MSSGPESPARLGPSTAWVRCSQGLVLPQMALLWDRAWGWWPQLGPGTSISRICHLRIQGLPLCLEGRPLSRRPECA